MRTFFAILTLALVSTKGVSQCRSNFSIATKEREVSFTNLSSTSQGVITANYWDFGDGSTSTDTNPVHTYPSPGIYAVRLAIQTKSSCGDTMLRMIRISPPATLVQVSLCPPSSTDSLEVDAGNATYQWLQSTDSVNYAELLPGGYYAGTNSSRLKLLAVPSSFAGYRYRCLINGEASNYIYRLRFLNQWVGTSGSNWSSPGNWSCGSLPDANTDVVISSGNVVVDSNATIRSLTVSPPGTITIQPGAILTVLH